MKEDIQHYEKQIILLRKQLVELELKRLQYGSNIPEEIWQVFADVSYQLDEAEQKVKGLSQQIITDLNHARSEIIESLEESMQMQEQIQNIEDQFMLNIVRPGYHLKKAVQQREYLEAEYHRMYKKIQRAGYADQVDLEQDIRRAISTAKAEEDQSYEDYQEELEKDNPNLADPWMDVDDLLEDMSKEELVKEFKRVVLPAIHPDTSTTPESVFNTVYEVYKKEDILLMEAYIIKYKGETSLEVEEDPLENLDRMRAQLHRCQRIAARLQRRIKRIKSEIASLELEHPEKLQENMKSQRQEILNRIQNESEQILYWREQIEGLVKVMRSQNTRTEDEI